MTRISHARARTGLTVVGAVSLALGLLALVRPPRMAPAPAIERGNPVGEWRYWGADAWSTRYSALDQINASNFQNLEIKWKWDEKTFSPDLVEYARFTPLYANGKLFTVAGDRRQVVSIDPETGETLWSWRLDEGLRWVKAARRFAGRGLAYWTDGRDERIVVITPGYHLAELDARTGRGVEGFGKDGIVDLEEGLGYTLVPWVADDSGALVISEGNPPRKARPGEVGTTLGIDPAAGEISNSSPAIIVNDVIVVGNSAIHGYYPIHRRNINGTIRGFDIHTGKQLWVFNLVPHKGEFGNDTWLNDSWEADGMGKVDAWAVYSADPELGLVYIPVGEGLNDRYGGLRPGNNLFANSIVAIDVKTGKRKWHYQMVHHDMWDYDAPMAPNLLDVTVNGQRRRIVAQSTKQGFLYVLDRATGEPIWPIVETPVPASEAPGEIASPTQPIPTRPDPYAQQGLQEKDLIDYTPAIKAAALAAAQVCRMGPVFTPFQPAEGGKPSGKTCTWYMPGAAGGVNIDGGSAVDPETGMIYVASQSPVGAGNIVHDTARSEQPYIQGTGGAGRSTIGGVSIVKPKEYGGITAYDLNTGDKVWWIPNGGVMRPVTSTDPMFAGITLPPIPARGGLANVMVTKTLVMYGTGRSGGAGGGGGGGGRAGGRGAGAGGATPADQGPLFYGVDKKTGKQVGAVAIPAATSATPMTFLHKGKQYIVFATAGHELVALGLPDAPTGSGRGRGSGGGDPPPPPHR